MGVYIPQSDDERYSFGSSIRTPLRWEWDDSIDRGNVSISKQEVGLVGLQKDTKALYRAVDESTLEIIGGNLTGNGTTGTIPKFDDNFNLIDSIISESGDIITLNGSGSNTGFKLDCNGSSCTIAWRPLDDWLYLEKRIKTDNDLLVGGKANIADIQHETTNTNRFLVSSGGYIKYRTCTELLSDIGGVSSSDVYNKTESRNIAVNSVYGHNSISWSASASGEHVYLKLATITDTGTNNGLLSLKILTTTLAEFSADVEIFVPTYTGFGSLGATNPFVTIKCGGLEDRTNALKNILIERVSTNSINVYLEVVSTSDNTVIVQPKADNQIPIETSLSSVTAPTTYDSYAFVKGNHVFYNDNGLTLGTIPHDSTSNAFLTSASGTIKYRTASEVLSDIGGVSSSGTDTYISKFNSSGNLVDSMISEDTSNHFVKVEYSSYYLKTIINGVDSAIELLSNGEIWIVPNNAVWIQGALYVNDINNSTIDTDKFLVDDNGDIKYRTGTELLSDIGGVGGTGSINTIPMWSNTTGRLEDSIMYQNNSDTGIEVDGTFKAGDVTSTDYTEIEDDGTLVFHGDAIVYDDQQVTLGDIPSAGWFGNEWADYVSYGYGCALRFKQSSSNNYKAAFNMQITHRYAEGEDIELHIHVGNDGTSTGNVHLKVYLQWANMGDEFPSTSSVTATDIIFAMDGVDRRHQYTELKASISGTGKKISSIVLCTIERDTTNDTYSDDLKIIAIDYHVPINTVGSRLIGTK